MVCQNTDVGESPSEDVCDDQDGGILAVSSNVGIVLANFAFCARSLAVPLISRFALIAGGHCDVFCYSVGVLGM